MVIDRKPYSIEEKLMANIVLPKNQLEIMF